MSRRSPPAANRPSLEGRTFVGPNGRLFRMIGGVMQPAGPAPAVPGTPATKAKKVIVPAAEIMVPPQAEGPTGLAWAVSRGLRLPVLLRPDGKLVIVYARTGKQLTTDMGPLDIHSLQERYDPKRPTKFGEMKAADVAAYRKAATKLASQPSGRLQDADVDAGPVYALVSAGLLTSEEASTILGLGGAAALPHTPQGRLRAIGFSEQVIESLTKPAVSKVPVSPLIPKAAKDRKRRITPIE